MKLLVIVALVATMLMSSTTVALAGTDSGTTVLLDTPVSGTTVDVDVSVISGGPVVAYLYSLQNECYFSGKANGKPDTYQADAIVNWVYSSEPPYGEVPHATMTVNLLPVPTGSVCKVFIMKNNTKVKGSTTLYDVE